MSKTTNSGPKQNDPRLVDKLWNLRAELLWGFAVAVLLFAVVDPVLLIGIALAIATLAAAWLGFRELLHRADRDDAQPASATHVDPAPATQRDPEKTSPHTPPWHDHHHAA
jgi:hypothetical protein